MKQEKEELILQANRDFPFESHSSSRCCGKLCLFGEVKEKLKFIGSNIVAFLTGFGLAMIIRACIGAASKHEPGPAFEGRNGTEFAFTDLVSCVVSLALCNYFWREPIKGRYLKTICRDPKLLARITLRNLIPCVVGLGAMFLTKFIDVETNGPEHVVHGPNNSRLFEMSDGIGSFFLLVCFHVIDRLLEWKWPANPYREIVSLNW